jgi:hypothetical protein
MDSVLGARQIVTRMSGLGSEECDGNDSFGSILIRPHEMETSGQKGRQICAPPMRIRGASFHEHRHTGGEKVFTELVTTIGQAGTVVVGSIGVFVALRNQHRQLNAQMFIEFSGRFQDLLRLFPTEVWLANRDSSQPMPPSSKAITDCTFYAVQFIADVYHLHKGGYISTNLWRLWEREIRSTLRGRVFQREWKNLSVEFAHSTEFVSYIDAIMNCRPQQGRRLVLQTIKKPCDGSVNHS